MLTTCDCCHASEIGGMCPAKRRARREAEVQRVLELVGAQLGLAIHLVLHTGGGAAEDFPALVRLGCAPWN